MYQTPEELKIKLEIKRLNHNRMLDFLEFYDSSTALQVLVIVITCSVVTFFLAAIMQLSNLDTPLIQINTPQNEIKTN
jgi:hypothetical protein